MIRIPHCSQCTTDRNFDFRQSTSKNPSFKCCVCANLRRGCLPSASDNITLDIEIPDPRRHYLKVRDSHFAQASGAGVSPSVQNMHATCGKDAQRILTVPTKKLETHKSPARAMSSHWSRQHSNRNGYPTTVQQVTANARVC